MALYSFACPDCGLTFEKVIIRVVAEPKAECPSCGGVTSKRGFDLPAKTAGRPTTSPKPACPAGIGPCGKVGCQRGGRMV